MMVVVVHLDQLATTGELLRMLQWEKMESTHHENSVTSKKNVASEKNKLWYALSLKERISARQQLQYKWIDKRPLLGSTLQATTKGRCFGGPHDVTVEELLEVVFPV
jgi:hypothetical protein